jgi:hypothetical protein
VFHIDEPLAQFVQSGLAAIVGTASDDGRPHIAYGWAPRISENGSGLDIFLDAARATQTLNDLESNGRIALTVADPVSYRSIQFKGRSNGWSAPSGGDAVWVAAYREAFLVNTSLVGDPVAIIRNMWLDEFVRVGTIIERAFDQTPGPAAGQAL